MNITSPIASTARILTPSSHKISRSGQEQNKLQQQVRPSSYTFEPGDRRQVVRQNSDGDRLELSQKREGSERAGKLLSKPELSPTAGAFVNVANTLGNIFGLN